MPDDNDSKLNRQTIVIPDTNSAHGQQTVVIVQPENGGGYLSIGGFSITFGIIGIFILAVVFAPLGVIFGISAIRKDQKLLGFTGIFLSIIAACLSPTFWAIFRGLAGVH